MATHKNNPNGLTVAVFGNTSEQFVLNVRDMEVLNKITALYKYFFIFIASNIFNQLNIYYEKDFICFGNYFCIQFNFL